LAPPFLKVEKVERLRCFFHDTIKYINSDTC
jgi:hypothetical protein